MIVKLGRWKVACCGLWKNKNRFNVPFAAQTFERASAPACKRGSSRKKSWVKSGRLGRNRAEAAALSGSALGAAAALRFGFLRGSPRSKVAQKAERTENWARPEVPFPPSSGQVPDNARARPPRGPNRPAKTGARRERPNGGNAWAAADARKALYFAGMKVATFAIVKSRAGRLLVCRRRRFGRPRYEFPAAIADEGEALEDALERELFLEFGLRIRSFGRVLGKIDLDAEDVLIFLREVKLEHFYGVWPSELFWASSRRVGLLCAGRPGLFFSRAIENIHFLLHSPTSSS